MGNVCSSGQNKNDTDSTSEKSEQSAAYQNADTNKKEAPLVDPEPISDVSVGGHNTILSINPSSANGNNINAATTTTTTTSTNRTSTNNQQQFKSQSTTLNESVSSTPQTTLPPSEPSLLSSSSSVNIDLPVNLLPLQGKPISNRRTEKDKKIILYILSADDDPHKNEKTALYSVYHQILKDYCACHGFEILISDVHRDDGDDLLNSKNEQQQQQQQQRDDINKSSVLDVRKWVNNPLEAQGGHEEAANCLAEISRHSNFSYIIPILFLGNSLGTPLLPLTIESQDFTTALNIISDNSKKLLLEKWYRLDNSAQPQCYRLNTTTKNDIINNLDSDQINIELNQLLTILIEIFSKELCDSYLTTVVEQEINNTVLISQELSKRCIWIQTGSFIMKLPENSNVLEIEMNRRLCTLHMDLKNQLTEKNLIRVPPSVQMQNQLTLILEKHLCTIIDGIIEEHSNKFSIPNCTFGVDKRLLNELECISQYSKFLGQNCANFTVMEKLKNYVTGNSTTPLIIYGSSGSGKSVVIAKLMNNLHTWLPDCYLILRYVNLTEISSHLTSLIGSIAEQISFIVNKKPCRISHTLKSYADFIKTSLESLNKSHHLIIVIDSLDDINGLNSIDWLPIQFSSNIKIIITLSDEKQINNNNDLVRSSSSSLWLMNELKKNENVIPSENFIHLSRLSEEQWTDIISFCGGGGGAADFYAANSSLLLPDKWCQTEEKLPLQAKILWWLAWAGVTDLKNTNLITIIDKFFDVIENKFDKNVTEFIFSILTVAKYGILETDLIALLSELNICKDIPSASKLWFKFCWFIGPMLLHSNQISIMDRKIKFSIMQRYKNKSDEAHHILYLYFKKQDSIFTDKKGKYKCYNTQKLLRLPYHSFTIEQQQDKQQKSFINSIYLTDLQWIYDKLVSSGCVNVLSDIHLILTENELSLNLDDLIKNVNDDHNYIIHIQLLRIFIENNFRELNYDGKQFYALFNSFLQNTIKDYQLETVSSIGSNETIKKWMKFLSNVKTTYLKRLSDFIASNSDDNVNDNDNVDDNDNDEIEKKLQSKGYDFVVNLSGQGYFVASVSTQREEICVWDVSKCKKVRTHKGIPQPTLLCPIGDCDAAVLCRREIKVIDLDNGKFKVTLKGVMNQKMPYFGLHDSKHVVCLSRNRMYVNLMNLESGDCVTTFKAGEDRFLNSLLVSGDGRILVCGDETQKPFPLLVWHLSQRKLLYDLRIPHHDFITSLSAITYEGSYVCVVAKELNEPTPNFIVVYDLQSGTLFKKWKPSCNTVSLAISQTNTCVIAGLEDARILVWDLVTGNCRSTLSGHNAPVTLLKLDPLGKILLSGDKDGRDMSIRLWELDFGKPLAVYTPPTKISACEILSNGIYVVLALVNHPNLITLMLCNYQQQQQQTIGDGDDNNETMVNICSNDNNSSLIIYGNPENEGKIFNLGSS